MEVIKKMRYDYLQCLNMSHVLSVERNKIKQKCAQMRQTRWGTKIKVKT